MPSPNTRLFKVVTPLQKQAFPVSTLKAMLPVTPFGLHSWKLPAPMHKHQNVPAHLPKSMKAFSNLHDALRAHMHSENRLRKADPGTGYY
eukprot:scaffold89843_cov15-Tisochrysis_lutea.AAC.1